MILTSAERRVDAEASSAALLTGTETGVETGTDAAAGTGAETVFFVGAVTFFGGSVSFTGDSASLRFGNVIDGTV